MSYLNEGQRRKLEKTVERAREVAELGARAAIEQLAVHRPEPFAHLSPEQRDLRNRLRARARQLGDKRDARSGEHQIDHLVVECAYEHWHRMLFARFLAENNVLMHPDGVAVTLEECEELAPDEGAEDGWELAAWYAAEMLPQIFRPDAPVLEVKLPPERQRELERLLADLPPEVFKASDSLGWVYQFWQAKKKDEVNKSEVKIGADELPAVTQLFTEPYMVQFLLHNTLGAWWVGRRLTTEHTERTEKNQEEKRSVSTVIAVVGKSEDELRDRFTVGGYRFDYLRFDRVDEEGTTENTESTESTESTEGEQEKSLSVSSVPSVVDPRWRPAAGAFDGWPDTAAEITVLDPCCGSGHFLVAAFEILVHFRMAEEKLKPAEACDAVLRDNIHGLEIDERCTQIAAFALALAAWTFPGSGGYRVLPEMHIACSGLAPRAKKREWLALAGDDVRLRNGMERLYVLFASAPTLGSLVDPTIGSSAPIVEAQFEEIRPLVEKALRHETADYAARELFVAAQGIASAAAMLSARYHLVATNVPWLAWGSQTTTLQRQAEMISPYGKPDLATVFLERCVRFCSVHGVSAVVVPQNWLYQDYYRDFRRKLLSGLTWHSVIWLGPSAFSSISGEVVKPALVILSTTKPSTDDQFVGCDVNAVPGADAKATALRERVLLSVSQQQQLRNPDVRVLLQTLGGRRLLSEFFDYGNGIQSGDYPRFGRVFWEIPAINDEWAKQQTTVRETAPYAGLSNIFYWQNGRGDYYRFVVARLGASGVAAWIRGANAWGKRGIAISPTGAIKAALYTGELFDDNTIVLIPKQPTYLAAAWEYCSSPQFGEEVRRVDKALKVRGALVKVPFDHELWRQRADEKGSLPEPYSPDPTQWIFHGHPADATEPLQVAVARLLGYRWPAELDEEMDLSDEARAWVARTRDLDDLVDDDGIVCLPAVRGEQPAATRLRRLLARAFGDDWSAHKQAELLAAVGCRGWTLERWLQDKFFAQHCKLFQNRPFIWHIWDGLKKGGFSALVNYHKLDGKLLETLTYNYLGDWIRRQQDGVKRGEDGAAERLAAAKGLQEKLKLILKGEPPCDIFVRWKPIEEQPMGWDPDINDGVRVNIRPFMLVGDVGKKGAGVLRDKPNIKWGKDRGKDPPDAPWYHLFKGDRINDHHLTLAEKQAAREKIRARAGDVN